MVQAAPANESRVAGADPVLERVRAFYNENHDGIERARKSHRYFYSYLENVLKLLIPPGHTVLDIGCGAGHVLAGLGASRGVGLDVSARAIGAAREAHRGEHLHFMEGDGSDPVAEIPRSTIYSCHDQNSPASAMPAAAAARQTARVPSV